MCVLDSDWLVWKPAGRKKIFFIGSCSVHWRPRKSADVLRVREVKLVWSEAWSERREKWYKLHERNWKKWAIRTGKQTEWGPWTEHGPETGMQTANGKRTNRTTIGMRTANVNILTKVGTVTKVGAVIINVWRSTMIFDFLLRTCTLILCLIWEWILKTFLSCLCKWW